MIELGEVRNAAELARTHEVSRARISQIMGLLRLAPEILGYIDTLGDRDGVYYLTERRLRELMRIRDWETQVERFRGMVAVKA